MESIDRTITIRIALFTEYTKHAWLPGPVLTLFCVSFISFNIHSNHGSHVSFLAQFAAEETEAKVLKRFQGHVSYGQNYDSNTDTLAPK